MITPNVFVLLSYLYNNVFIFLFPSLILLHTNPIGELNILSTFITEERRPISKTNEFPNKTNNLFYYPLKPNYNYNNNEITICNSSFLRDVDMAMEGILHILAFALLQRKNIDIQRISKFMTDLNWRIQHEFFSKNSTRHEMTTYLKEVKACVSDRQNSEYQQECGFCLSSSFVQSDKKKTES